MSQRKLVEKLEEKGKVSDLRVMRTMMKVDRKYFYEGPGIYEDKPKKIGFNATISAPHMHAYALECLKDYLKPGIRVLDIGSGSGYFTVCLSEMIYNSGKVIGIEHVPELVEKSISNINSYNPNLLSSSAIEIKHGDGRLGYPDFSPYHIIHLGACTSTIPPPILSQLSPDGLLLLPLGDPQSHQNMTILTKSHKNEIHSQTRLKVYYIPLCSLSDQIH